ncbi:MAG: hypothetical protein QOH86_1752, partial [Sphingomonadales bacterium]|nr:hypothetical protein [Sphingomonadales bacterium]
AIAAPIASARTPEQADEILGAMTLELSADQVARLTEASAT